MRSLAIAVVTILLFGTSCGVLADSPSQSKPAADLAAARAAIAAKGEKADSIIASFAASYPQDLSTPRLLKAEMYISQGKLTDAADAVKAGLLADKAGANSAWAVDILDKLKPLKSSPDPGLLEKLGDGYRIAKYFPEAVTCYEAALAKPGAVDGGKRIRRWLLTCHIRSKQWDKVAKEIDAVVADWPECAAWSYYSLGRYYQRLGDYKSAVAAFNKAMPPGKPAPASPAPKDIQTALAESYIGAKQWDEATALVKTLAAQHPEDAAHWHECAGAILQGQRKYQGAIVELRLAIEPKTAVSARKRLAECYRDSLKPAEAAPLIQQLVDRYATDGPDVPMMLGKLYQGMKQYDKAVAAYMVLIENSPDARWQAWDACVGIAECLYPQGKGDEALDHIKGFYSKHPDRPMDFAIAYGRAMMDVAHKPAEAAVVFSRALAEHTADPLAGVVRTRLAIAYAQANRVDDAARTLKSGIGSAEPAERTARTDLLATIYFDHQRYREAALEYRALFNTAAASAETRARAGYQLGICYRNSSMPVAGRRVIEDVVQRFPTTEVSKDARGLLYVWDTYAAGTP